MLSPVLAQFLIHPPGFPLSTPIGEVTQALAQHSSDLCSYIIIIDAQQRPVGALSVRHLWRCISVASETLERFQSDIEPTLQVYAQQPLMSVWPLPPADIAPPVVVVDEAMRYLGIVSPPAVLAWLADTIQFTDHSRPQKSPSPPPESPTKSWLLEVSHTLKNPMTSLLGLATLLLDPRVGPLNDRQTRYAGLIQQVVRRLISLVNQLLDWMRLDAGQLQLSVEPIALSEFVHGTWERYRLQLPSTQATATWTERFRLELPPEPLELQGDPVRLHQSLHGVLDYFLQHQAEPAGMKAALWGPWLGLTLWTITPELHLPEGLTQVGQVAEGADQTVQPTPLDSLGLLLARRFCQGQGGDLTYCTTTHGTWITLLLPQGNPANIGQKKSEPTALVLLLSYRPNVIEQVALKLQNSCYRLAIARSEAEARGMVQRLQPTVVLRCDQSFPAALPDLTNTLYPPPGAGITCLKLKTSPGPVTVDPTDQTEPTVTLNTLTTSLRRFRTPLLSHGRNGLPSLTLLLLPLSSLPLAGSSGLTPELRFWLQHYQCRLLQVDDLPQARVLSRVWQPDALLIDAAGFVARDHWQTLAQDSELAKLPLVALTTNPIEADAVPTGIKVYDCSTYSRHPPELMATDLIETIAAALDQ
jgi:hypothetical protein